jgi:gliding motility-associated lipoprotein GldD
MMTQKGYPGNGTRRKNGLKRAGRWSGVRRTGRHAGFIALGMVLIFLYLDSCKQSYTPKPAGYMKITFPEKAYRLYSDQQYYQFEIPVYARVDIDSGPRSEPGWINVEFPSLNGTIHLSYKPVDDHLNALITDCRELVYKHTVKAQGIEETPFIEPDQRRFGMIYDLKGDVASAVQFFITDSTDHFLRGSLYFNCRPNRDSLNPVIDFLREDILHLIETTQWKY